MRFCVTTTFAMLTFSASTAAAHEFKLGDLTVDHPYAFETAETAKAGAGYLTIINEGAEADRLIGVEAPFPRTELHITEVDADGVARMTPVEAVEIPPGETVTLKPQDLHVMFMGLSDPLKDGDKIDATLTFEGAGTIDIQFAVQPRNGSKPDHDDMGDDDMEHGDMEHGDG